MLIVGKSASEHTKEMFPKAEIRENNGKFEVIVPQIKCEVCGSPILLGSGESIGAA